MKKTPIILLIILGLSNSLFAQDISVKNSPRAKYITPDTVYYLADTAKTPKNDRILTIADAYLSKNFTIHCSCLNTEKTYIVLVSVDQRKAIVIDQLKFKSLKLTTLATLISTVKANNTANFGKKYIVYVIEPRNKNQYTLHQVANYSNNIIQGGN